MQPLSRMPLPLPLPLPHAGEMRQSHETNLLAVGMLSFAVDSQ